MKITRTLESVYKDAVVSTGDCFVCENDVYIVALVNDEDYRLVSLKDGGSLGYRNVYRDKTVKGVSNNFVEEVTFIPAHKANELIEVVVHGHQ